MQATLFGRGAVHTLDGADHRTRKALFRPLFEPAGIVATQRMQVGIAHAGRTLTG